MTGEGFPPALASCPVDGCTWTRQLTIPWGVQYLTLEAMEQAQRRMWRRHEDALADHSLRHSPMEYLRTIQRMNTGLAGQRGSIALRVQAERDVCEFLGWLAKSWTICYSPDGETFTPTIEDTKSLIEHWSRARARIEAGHG